MRLFRLIKIVFVVLRFGLDEFLLAHERVRWMRVPLNIMLFLRNTDKPRAVRLRLALEALGPIFVKFGQMLSTRRDLIPADIADELAKLQDQVPPFLSAQAVAVLEAAYGKPLRDVFQSFDERRWPARRSRRCILRYCQTAVKLPSRFCVRASPLSSPTM